jgi:hypothetical protein
MTNTAWRSLIKSPVVGMLLLLIITGINSCVSAEVKEQQASAKRISHLLDSLSSAGEHGYHVAYFLVGRFKTSPMERSTFDVSVSSMDERLLEHPIRFRVLDAETYELSYSLKQSETVLIGEFDQVLDTDLLRILIARPLSADSASLQRLMTSASYFDHELKVYRY